MSANDQPMFSPGVRLAGTPYRMLRLLGSGGMGEVYEAEHVELGITRAVKVLTVQDAALGEGVARLRAEARALARLRHPNIVEALDLGTSADGHTYFAMELLEGITLRKLMSQGALAPAFAVHIVLAILDGLGAAHRADLVHRDVKPENVFICKDGSVRLLDFGVAKWIAEDHALTRSGVLLGTPRYMAPEQLRGDAVDARADVYAVGVLLHELIAGRPPFDEDRALALAYAHLSRPAPPLVSPHGSLPEGLVRAADAAMAKEPRQRPPSAAAFARSLRECELAAIDGRDACARAATGRGDKAFGIGAVVHTPSSDAPVAVGSYEHFVNVATVAATMPARGRGRWPVVAALALVFSAGITLAVAPGGRRAVARLGSVVLHTSNQAAPSVALAAPAPVEVPPAPSALPAAPTELAVTVASDAGVLATTAPTRVKTRKKVRPRVAAAAVATDAGVSVPAAPPPADEPGSATEEE